MFQYREKYGPLNPMLRLDAAIARFMAWKSGRPNAKPSDYMPWPREEEPEATPEMILQTLKSSMKVKKPNG